MSVPTGEVIGVEEEEEVEFVHSRQKRL